MDRKERRLTALKAQMRIGEKLFEITVSNISETGLMAKMTEPPPAGTEVEILRRSARVRGSIVWSEGRRFGMKANEPIDLNSLLADSGLGLKQSDTGAAAVRKSWWHWSKRR
ncbi:hypothetical protein FHS61_002149 [Altererythrobacter atlanticus]|uniref:Uncharacterized protein n=2 Tax=Croceibacterium atlanticum TaxID=1267766 RepID=A0A0F7KQ32_9SPHN|nr:PilZ domain-containing protein [Croceibacterium atlanticum]AKH41659.1 hypothetical protein WYH_00603 [Croceibacterium atlanticum]MBB5733123.1 hypothetical protein [Croceibacterium atlanticum]